MFMNAIVYRAVKMFLKNFHNRQLAVALLPDVDWIIKKSVRAILVARSTVRGSGMCPSQSNEQTCRSLTQNMQYEPYIVTMVRRCMADVIHIHTGIYCLLYSRLRFETARFLTVKKERRVNAFI